MNCNKCGSPLPNKGIVCNFCGAAMSPEQLKYMQRMQDKNNKQIELLSEKYGQDNNIKYQSNKENKILGLIIIIVILVFLGIITILINR